MLLEARQFLSTAGAATDALFVVEQQLVGVQRHAALEHELAGIETEAGLLLLLAVALLLSSTSLAAAEGQLRGIQRMVERGEDCLKVAQQFSAVRRALDSTYVRMTVCLLEQEIGVRLQSGAGLADGLPAIIGELEAMLSKRG